MGWLRLWATYIRMRIMIMLEFRAVLPFAMANRAMGGFLAPLALAVMYGQGLQIPGWSLYELLLLNGLFQIVLGLTDAFFFGLMSLPDMVRTGEFEGILIRPLGPLRHLLISDFDQEGLGNLVAGVVLTILAVAFGNLQLTWYGLALLPIFIVSGVLALLSFFTLLVTLSFWFVEVGAVIWEVRNIEQYAKNPLSVYPSVVQLALSVIVPLGIANYYPALILLGKQIEWWMLLAPLWALVLWVIARKFFYIGLSKYSSAGG